MTPLQELHGKICGDIRSRQDWLRRQSTWYAMRHDGLRRGSKPWPGAADLHYPLTDSIIEKLKPFYFSQIFGTETLARLVAAQPELAPYAQDAGAWFDFKLKQQTNLEGEILVAIDKMLMAGHVPVKVYWDPRGPAGETAAGKARSPGRLAFDAIEPQHCIVPESTRALEDADRVTLVHHLSTEQYRRDARFLRRDEEFLQRISGRGTTEEGEAVELEQNRHLREGITHAASQNGTVIVWEIWEQDETGWMLHWISPLAPSEPLRPSQRNPFRHGRLPIVRFNCEIKDKGHYAARGIPEKAGAFENSLCKYWNEKSDYLTLCNRPLFTSNTPIPNAGNFRFYPGQIIPGGVSAIQMPPPPVSFDQEMTQTRMIAEYHIGMPDFGLGQYSNTNQRRTATEVEKLSGLMGMNVDLRARTFRMSLGALLQLAWSTLLQYDRDTQYFVEGELRHLADGALAEEGWLVQPNGSSESWNREAQFKRAMLRKQLFAQSPWINQPELDRSLLELDDPRLVQRLFLAPKLDAGNGAMKQPQAIPQAIAQFTKRAPAQPGTRAAGRETAATHPPADVPMPLHVAPLFSVPSSQAPGW